MSTEATEIVTDKAIDDVWDNSNFGTKTKREVVDGAVLKCASGYYTGHTAKCIVEELGLVTKKWTLTRKGQKYLYAAFNGGNSV